MNCMGDTACSIIFYVFSYLLLDNHINYLFNSYKENVYLY